MLKSFYRTCDALFKPIRFALELQASPAILSFEGQVYTLRRPSIFGLASLSKPLVLVFMVSSLALFEPNSRFSTKNLQFFLCFSKIHNNGSNRQQNGRRSELHAFFAKF